MGKSVPRNGTGLLCGDLAERKTDYFPGWHLWTGAVFHWGGCFAAHSILADLRMQEKRSCGQDRHCTGGDMCIYQSAEFEFFPWEQVQKIRGVGMVVSSMQFPFRWLGISVAFGAAFVAYASAKILETASWNGKLGIVALLFMSLAGSSYQLSQIVFTDNETQLYTAANMGTISLILGEYLITDELDMAFSYHDPAAEDPVQWYDYEKQGTNITITVENSSEQEHRLELPLQGYQGYRAVDAGGAEIEIAEERGAHGDLTLRIPAEYEGTISVAYVGFPIFKTAEGITLFSVLISAGYLIYRCSKGRKRAETNESYV